MPETSSRGPWIQTYTGGRFYVLSPHPDDVLFDDIAHALSMVCRFAGHSRYFISVAEHSYNVSLVVKELGGSLEEQIVALIHDSAEAYLGDFTRPVKRAIPELEAIERRVLAAVFAKLLPGVSCDLPEVVRNADDIMLAHECHVMMGGELAGSWGLTSMECINVNSFGWSQSTAKREFVKVWKELSRAWRDK